MEREYVFTGKDGSLGHRTGRTYRLVFMARLAVTRTDGTGYCPYGTWKAFLRNWDMLPMRE